MKLFGTMALAEKDKATADRHGTAAQPQEAPRQEKQVIAFTLFGSKPRYLRGALHNVLATKDLYRADAASMSTTASTDL
jgi:hypothetical protein